MDAVGAMTYDVVALPAALRTEVVALREELRVAVVVDAT
jgi:hypothetical protein